MYALRRLTPHHIARAGLRRCLSAETALRSEGGVVTLSLNRPAAKNSIGRAMLTELEGRLAEIQTMSPSEGRCVVVQSDVAGVFCAGADLKERKTMPQEEVDQFVSRLRAMISAVAALPMPTVAAVDGFALGGGLEIALACDLRVAGPGAQLGVPETRLGIIPGAGGSQRLPRIVGAARAKEMMFTGRRLDAKAADAIGLAIAAADGADAASAAAALAAEIALGGPIAVRAAKEAIDRGGRLEDLDAAFAVERECYAKVIGTQDRLEGLAAFAEKRTPVYRGE